MLFLSNSTAYAHHFKKRLKITSTVLMGMNFIYIFGENFGDHPSVRLGEHKLDIISVENGRIEAWLPEALEDQPGTYRLYVAKYRWRYPHVLMEDTMDVTIGAGGPAGPPGPPGVTYNPKQIALLRWYDAIQTEDAFDAGIQPQAIAFDGAYMWVANSRGELRKLSASDGSEVAKYEFGGSLRALAFDGENIWVASSSAGTVTKLCASDGSKLVTCDVGNRPQALVFDGVHIWVTNYSDNTVMKVSASDGSVLGTYNVGRNPRALAFDGANIWVANYGSSSVMKR